MTSVTDQTTGLTILAGAVGSAQLVVKILGPTAAYVGDGLKHWTERGVTNVGRIFTNAGKRLGSKIESEGSVPPKVLKEILSHGSFCDDELTAEYFGGVLASSRTGIARDDRGAAFTALIGGLSSYQVRAHYYFYSLVKILFDGDSRNVNTPEGRRDLEVFIPFESYEKALEFSPDESSVIILNHIMFGLAKEGLIEQSFRIGANVAPGSHGIVFQPSALGTELYLWAHGRGDLHVVDFLRKEVSVSSDIKMVLHPGFKPTHAAVVN